MANTAMFESYEEEYTHLSHSISRRIGQISQFSGEQKKALMQDTEKEIDEAESTLQQMDIEARTLPAAVRNKLSGRLKNYRADLAKLKQDMRRAVTAFGGATLAAQRDELLGGAGADLQVTSLDQRARLLQSTDRLEDSSRRIQESHQTVVRTEELGAGILGDLHRQRGVIDHSRDGLRRADDNVSRSRRILGAMGRRVMTNKLILAIIIVVLLAMIGLVIYLRYFNKPNGTPPPASG